MRRALLLIGLYAFPLAGLVWLAQQIPGVQ